MLDIPIDTVDNETIDLIEKLESGELKTIDWCDNWHNTPINSFLVVRTSDGYVLHLLKWTNTPTEIIGVPFINPHIDEEDFWKYRKQDKVIIRINKEHIIYIKLGYFKTGLTNTRG